MITLKEIKFLPLQKKAQYVWNKGMYCYSYWEGKYKINLYWLGSFYVQIWHDEEENQVRNIVFQEADLPISLQA
jgi:hypothetical protein